MAIVAEVFVGMLQMNDASYLTVDPDWTPTIPMADSSTGYVMTDMLRTAGVDPDTRGE